MHSFDLQPLLDWLTAHPGWGGLMVFLIASGESLLIVGLIVPGTVAMFAVGALVALGALELWSTLWWSFAGAIAGDVASYWIGYYLKERLHRVWPFSRYPRLLERGEGFFHRHGGKSVLIGRFVGPVRPVIPAVAGMLGMAPGRFLLFNVLSAAGWAPVYLLPGIALGASFSLAAEVGGRLALLLGLVTVVLAATYWAIHHLANLLQPHAARLAGSALEWGMRHPLLGRLSGALLDPRRPEPAALTIFAAALVAGVWLFVAMIGRVVAGLGGDGRERALFELVQNLRTPFADHLMTTLTAFGDSRVLLPLAAAVALGLLRRQDRIALWHWLAGIAFAWAVPPLLKIALAIPRPIPLPGIDDFSFPSSHTLRATVVYGLFAALLSRALPLAWRWLPYATAGTVIAAVALSRIYLGAHWPSDVAGGAALGIAWAALLGIGYQRHAGETPPSAARIGSLALLALALALPFHFTTRWHRDLAHYAPLPHPIRLEEADWRTEGWRRLPPSRIDLRALPEEPLTVQYAGTPAALREHLGRFGWTPPPRLTLAGAMLWLAPDRPLAELALLPHFHDGRGERLLLRRDGSTADRQWLLRLWRSDAHLTPGEIPVWVGAIESQRLSRPLPWVRYPRRDRTAPPGDITAEVLGDALAGWEIARHHRPDGADELLLRQPAE